MDTGGPAVRLTVLLAGALTMAGCGRGSESGSGAPAVGAAFANRAEAVCRDTVTLKDAQRPFPFPDFNPSQPDVSKLPIIAPFLEETVHTFSTWLQDLQALGDPPSGKEAWADVLKDVQSHVRIATEQQKAAEQSDVQTFVRDFEEGSAVQDDMLQAANAAGVPGCAEVDR